MVVSMVCCNPCGKEVDATRTPDICVKAPHANLYTSSIFHPVFHITVFRVLNVFESKKHASNLQFGSFVRGFPPLGQALIRTIDISTKTSSLVSV